MLCYATNQDAEDQRGGEWMGISSPKGVLSPSGEGPGVSPPQPTRVSAGTFPSEGFGADQK